MEARPRLLDTVRERLRVAHYSYRTEQQYLHWIKRFVLFHGKRHPAEMSATEVAQFLTHLAVDRQVAASTQNQALSALIFLYRQVLEIELPRLEDVARARRPVRLPVVLSQEEARRLLSFMSGQFRLMAGLMYGSGLRLMETLRLRVKDLDFDYCQITVRDGKGAKDRVTVLPRSLVPSLTMHLRATREKHEAALVRRYAGVELPHALARKYPRAALDWSWQYVFPADRPSRDPRNGAWRRHHVYETTVQQAVRDAARAAGIVKRVGPHTLRHSFAALPHSCRSPARRLTWAQRLKRVFAIEIETCRRCGGRLRVIARIEAPTTIERILEHLGREAEPVDPAYPSRAPPQGDLSF